ncbi:MAG: SDR family oxidoreductase [Chloroflexota bacterium]|nr:SDR family oxidoreductase [Chloroflexota bacterium]
MKVAVIGANGRTGYQTVLKALDLGHNVTAVMRNPEGIELRHHGLRIRQADVTDIGSLKKALLGQEAVISAIGISTGLNKPITFYSEGTKNIIEAMKENKIRRLICISSIGIDKERDPHVPFIFQGVVFPIVFTHAAADMRLMEEAVQESKLDWTIVRPAGLTNRPPSWKYRAVKAPSLEKCYQISRADLADFMVKQLDNEQFFYTVASIAH